MKTESMKTEKMIEYLARFNVALYAELRVWSVDRLRAGLLFVKRELKK